jgi:glycerophosphoryl diester phosphodiesterase family protein
VDIGAVLREAWALYKRFFARFVVVAAAVFLVLGLVDALISSVGDDDGLALVFWGVVGVVISIIGYFWLQGTLVEAVRDVRDGRADVPVSELFRRTRPRLPALIVAGLLAGIAIGVGLILLIVPGLFLLTHWFLITPVIVLEGRSAGESFGRSWELVRGHAWQAFGLIALTIVIVILAAIVVAIIAAILLAPLPDVLGDWISNLVVNSLTAPFVALAWTLAYYRLAERPAEQALPA